MTDRTLGVDLASASWADNGSALLEFDRDRFTSVAPGAITWPGSALSAVALADAIDTFARAHAVTAVALDGPAGWRDPRTPVDLPGAGRRSELACRTQGKTGVYPHTYPGTQRTWIEHCIAVFDELLARPGVVLAESSRMAAPDDGYLLLECFPTSTWRAAGLTPLPAKSKRPALAPFAESLSRAFGLPTFSATSHDDLQAMVCGVVAAAAAGGPVAGLVHGVASRLVPHPDGKTRRVEGVIWDARPLDGTPAPPINSAPAPAGTACVTTRVLAEVNRTGSEGSMCVALSGTPAGSSASRVMATLRVDGEDFKIIIGDSHAAWRSHQSAETAADFEALFSKLADQADVRVPIDDLSVDD